MPHTPTAGHSALWGHSQEYSAGISQSTLQEDILQNQQKKKQHSLNFSPSFSPLKCALILHDEPDNAKNIESFKNGSIDLLFVYQMLLTGFDAPRLKKLYLMRTTKEHNLLQTLTRVNRPYEDMRYGYVVDFANIDEEFAKTNKAYLDELKDELEADLGEEFTSYNKLFKSEDEIGQQILEIEQALEGFEVSNKERFAKQIRQCEKDQLYTLRKALEGARELHNFMTLKGQTHAKLSSLEPKILLAIIQDRLETLALSEALSKESISPELLNVALEEYIFHFTKIGERELYLMPLKEYIKTLREGLGACLDKEDVQYVKLCEEFQRILQKHNTQEMSQDAIDSLILQAKALQERLNTYNASNELTCAKYNNDPKFLRIHKRTKEHLNGADSNHSALYENLIAIKEKVDNKVLNNLNLLENEPYFETEVRALSKEHLKAIFKQSPNTTDTTKHISHLIAQEYLNQYKQGALT